MVSGKKREKVVKNNFAPRGNDYFKCTKLKKDFDSKLDKCRFTR